jgi:rubrerythrin
MATEFQRMFGCPVCGFRIDEAEPTCPRCNNKFDSGTKFECPFCGELVDPKVGVCPACHVDYVEFKAKTKRKGSDANIDDLLTEIIKLESMQARQEPKKFSCPGCSWLLDGSESKCPKCGKDLSDEFAFQCPICGASVSSEARSCADCGAKFEDDGTTSPAAQPLIHELEDFAATVRTSPPTKEPEKEPEAPASIESPFTLSHEEPVTIEPPAMEPPAPEAQEPERPVEVGSEQPTEAPSVKPTAPKTKKRKLKAKSGAKPVG